MSDSDNLVGTRTTTHITNYYEGSCGNTKPHARHLRGAGGTGGGGVGGANGPMRGNHTIEHKSNEYWCPGVHGTIQV